MSIRKMIKDARVNEGLTQSELAEKLGWMQKDISRFENGIVSPSADKLDQIAKALGFQWTLFKEISK